VIVLTGSGSTRDDVLDHAALVARAGYGALFLDFRGHGNSGGRIMDLGWGAERDVHSAVSWVLGQPGVTRVGVLGLSMGGEVALTAAAEDPRIAAVVARERPRAPGPTPNSTRPRTRSPRPTTGSIIG
jgi:dipeptidyl aminopeptidase/acylaminoacyl peptidase